LNAFNYARWPKAQVLRILILYPYHLIAFSCRTRNFCSSCQAKRAALFAEKLAAVHRPASRSPSTQATSNPAGSDFLLADLHIHSAE
jgi:hypothetical protein